MSIYFFFSFTVLSLSEAIYSFCNVSSLCSLLISHCHCVKRGLHFLRILNVLAQSFAPSCIYPASELIISRHFLRVLWWSTGLLTTLLDLDTPWIKGQGQHVKEEHTTAPVMFKQEHTQPLLHHLKQRGIVIKNSCVSTLANSQAQPLSLSTGVALGVLFSVFVSFGNIQWVETCKLLRTVLGT